MAVFAMMAGNCVANTIVALSKEEAELATNAECIEISSENPAGIGWTYDEATGRFTRPTVE